jgi:ribosome-binding factor A
MPPHRPERVGERIHQEISLMFEREISDPRLANVTVTRVEVSGDLRVAKVFVVPVNGSDADTDEMMNALAHATGYFRRQVARSLDLKFAPEIRFVLDHTIQKGEHFLQVLEQVQAEIRAAEHSKHPCTRKTTKDG